MTILIVDDETTLLETIERRMRREGYSTFSALVQDALKNGILKGTLDEKSGKCVDRAQQCGADRRAGH